MHPSQTYTMQAQLLSNFLQPRVFVFKMGNFCLDSTQNISFVHIALEVGSVNHFSDLITPNFKGKSLHTV